MAIIDLTLPPETMAALARICAEENTTLERLIRKSIDKELYRRTRAKRAFKPDERLVAPLRALLADDLAYAQDWSDLQRRIGAKGYRVAESGGGIAVFRLDGTKVCKGSDLGCSYSRLMRQFGAPLPGHAHGHIARRVLGP